MAVTAAAAPSAGRTQPRRFVRVLADESLLIVVCAAFLGLLAILVPNLLSSDGWLALVGGRWIAHHGLPHEDALAAVTAGREWVDQQWLGQLMAYWVACVGMRVLLAVDVLLVAGAFTAALVRGRLRGGRAATVASVGLLGSLPYLVAGMNVRTQTLAYPLFVGVIALLSGPRPLRLGRVALVLSGLLVWANVHGSVLLGALLVSARGAFELRGRNRLLGWVLLVGPWVCVLASPYHVHLVSYYSATALNASFSTYLSQWAPTRFSAISAPLFVLLFAALWLLGRASRVYTPYERVVLGIAVVVGLLAVRNWPFCVLLIVQLAPVGLDTALRRRPERAAPAAGAALALVAGLAALAGIVGALVHAHNGVADRFPKGAADVAARAVVASRGTVYGGVEYSDWLLWLHPELAGRVAFDVRYELLHASEVKSVALFDAGSGLGRPLGAPTVYVLDKDAQKHALAGLRPDVRTVYETDHLVVAVLRSPN